MRISRSTKPLTRFYSLCNCVLQEVDQAKYLGVNISRELQWSGHITSTTGKANSSLAFLRRNLKNCPQKLKEIAYISLVRSVLEYSSSIWDPYHAKDISSIERIQRRAARFVKSDYLTTSSVTAMINDLGWKDLAHRRRVFQDSAGPGQVGLNPRPMRTHPIRVNTPPGGLRITPQDKTDGRTDDRWCSNYIWVIHNSIAY